MARRLCVSPNSRFLCREDGSPFFYLGDTAWELFHRLTVDESVRYLRDRAEKGFNVIQAVVVGELGGADVPNADGELPFLDRDVARPNEMYFRHVDEVVGEASRLGLTIGMLPTWGSFWKADSAVRLLTPENAGAYGRWLGARYRDADVIWVLGGDQNPAGDEELATVRRLAQGLGEGDGGAHLKTYHPRGCGQSSMLFHGDEWLDFNMCQSSHGARDHFNGAFILTDRDRRPVKPAMDGEPRYEQIPVGFYNRGIAAACDYFDDADVRQAAYWAVFSGACGHTYGNNNIWQMYDAGREPVLHAHAPWHRCLNAPGAFQMGYLRALMERIHFEALRPAPELLFNAPAAGGERIVAMRSEDDRVLAVYSPFGRPFGLIQPDSRRVYRTSWFDPRYNVAHLFHESPLGPFQSYAPPTSGRGCDWILLQEAVD